MNFLGLSLDKLLPIALLAVIVLGPSKLPYYAEKLRDGIRAVRGYADSAKQRMRDEIGPEFDEIDWQKMDPRKYDPRRIVRDAFVDEPPRATAAPGAVAADSGPSSPSARAMLAKASERVDGPAPFDEDAT
ncbi:MAG TPA: hypothetical protein H9830_02355 [Candidatus Agrococcus pullicola]|uniref:Sec-independent protein translocase TatB n=1 Tax=Candidatus Agrococcus pullicola TaxID=2838429 RepID=A0A9D2C8B8_9MICO|nr:hypothetical protein [Candidatus Agrococcus pullicola]